MARGKLRTEPRGNEKVDRYSLTVKENFPKREVL